MHLRSFFLVLLLSTMSGCSGGAVPELSMPGPDLYEIPTELEAQANQMTMQILGMRKARGGICLDIYVSGSGTTISTIQHVVSILSSDRDLLKITDPHGHAVNPTPGHGPWSSAGCVYWCYPTQQINSNAYLGVVGLRTRWGLPLGTYTVQFQPNWQETYMGSEVSPITYEFHQVELR